jgi:Ca2+-binding RTX toxin-like protein
MLSEITLANGSVTALTALANGTFLTVWNGAGNVPTAQIYNFDGTKKGGPIQLASGSTGENLNFTATSLSDGRFVVVWQQKDAQDGVYAWVFDVNGTPAGDAFKIASGSAAQTLPQVAALKDGGFVVMSINDGTATSVKVAADGSQGTPHAVQANALSIGLATLQSGDLITFIDTGGPGDYDMMGHVLAPDGVPYSSDRMFGDIPDEPLSPHVAGISDGGFILVSDGVDASGDAIVIHRFLSTGDYSYDGAMFAGSAGQTFDSPVIKALPGGGFVFAYTRGTSGGKDVYAGVTHANSTVALITETVGYDYTIGDQSSPEITILNDGRYVISWLNTVNGVTETRAEIFDPRTAAVNWTGSAFHEQYHGTIYDDTLSGGGGDDLIVGASGTDTLNGGSGQDTLKGGDDSDTYYIDSADDRVVESSGEGVDRVYAAVSHTLASYVEQLYASGSGSIHLTGNTLNNTLSGNSGANKINGGAGKDVLKGGTGKDTFIFSTKLSSSNADKILDFSVKYDTIWLDNAIFKKLGSGSDLKPGKLNKDFLTFGSKAKDKNDYLVYDKTKGALYYDADGSGSGKAVLIATLSKSLKVTYADFYVI